MRFFFYQFLLNINKLITYAFLAFYGLNLLFFYVTVLLVTSIAIFKSLDLEILANFTEFWGSLLFDPIFCMDNSSSSSSHPEPSTLQDLNKEGIRVDSIPPKFESTVRSVILYDSWKDSQNITYISKYEYIHLIIADPDCTLKDLENILSKNQIIDLIKSNAFHNQEMDADLALSIRAKYKSEFLGDESAIIGEFLNTQIGYKSDQALQAWDKELAEKYEKNWGEDSANLSIKK